MRPKHQGISGAKQSQRPIGLPKMSSGQENKTDRSKTRAMTESEESQKEKYLITPN
jgi:hypothetical protein